MEIDNELELLVKGPRGSGKTRLLQYLAPLVDEYQQRCFTATGETLHVVMKEETPHGPTKHEEHEDIVRVFRIVEYVGPRRMVEQQVSQSIHGTALWRGLRTVRISAATIGDFAQLVSQEEVKKLERESNQGSTGEDIPSHSLDEG